MINLLILLLLFSLQPCNGASPTTATMPKVRTKIMRLLALDQAVRNEIKRTIKNNRLTTENTKHLYQVDYYNSIELKKILRTIGWSSLARLGPEYEHALWLLVQHANHDVNLQKKFLTYFKNISNDPRHMKHYAYLYDRIRVCQHLPQRYATQGFCLQQKWHPFPLEDYSNINLLRRSVGLGRFEQYNYLMNQVCH
jgi:hypothetical protein